MKQIYIQGGRNSGKTFFAHVWFLAEEYRKALVAKDEKATEYWADKMKEFEVRTK